MRPEDLTLERLAAMPHRAARALITRRSMLEETIAELQATRVRRGCSPAPMSLERESALSAWSKRSAGVERRHEGTNTLV